MSTWPSLLLIGPAAAGKSTIGSITADILGVPFVDLDEIGADYYAEVDWSMNRLALGAGHTSYTDAACFADVRAATAKVPTVVLLLPTGERAPDLAELRRRSLTAKGTDWISSGHDFLAEWLDDPGMRSLATHLVVTEADTPRETALRVAGMVQAP